MIICVVKLQVLGANILANQTYKNEFMIEDFTSVRNLDDLLKQSDKMENSSNYTQKKYLHQFLLLYNYEQAQKDYKGKFNKYQLYAMLNRVHEFVYEFYEEDVLDQKLLNWISINIKKSPLQNSFIDSVKYILNAEMLSYNFLDIGNRFTYIICYLSGVAAGIRHDLIELTSTGYSDVHEELLIEKASKLMKRKFGNSVYAEDRNGIGIQKSNKHDFEVIISLHRNEDSGACCPDLFVKCRTRDFESIIPGSISYHYSKKGVFPGKKTKWKKYN